MKDGYYETCETGINGNKYLTTSVMVENYPPFSFYDVLEENDDILETWEKLHNFDLDETKTYTYDLYMLRYHDWMLDCSTDGIMPI